MSGQASARHRAQAAMGAFESEEVVGLGEKSAQAKGGAVYVPYPQPHARHDGVEHKTGVDLFYSGKHDVLLVVPNRE